MKNLPRAIFGAAIAIGAVAPGTSNATPSLVDGVYEEVATVNCSGKSCVIPFSLIGSFDGLGPGLIVNQVSCNIQVSLPGELQSIRLGDVNQLGKFKPSGQYLGTPTIAIEPFGYQFLFNTLQPYKEGTQPAVLFQFEQARRSIATCTINATPKIR